MEGGYQILNLGRINLTSTAKKVPGAYDYIEKNLQHKVVLLEGLKLDGKLYDSIFTTFAKSYGNYIGTFAIDAKLYSVVISADDLVHTKRLIPVGDDTIELVESMIAEPWESDEVYTQGDRVIRKHSLYELTADTSTGDPPESNPGKWKKVTVGSGGAGASATFDAKMPWSGNLTSSMPYTCPENGWIRAWLKQGSGGGAIVFVNGKEAIQTGGTNVPTVYALLQVQKGDVLTVRNVSGAYYDVQYAEKEV